MDRQKTCRLKATAFRNFVKGKEMSIVLRRIAITGICAAMTALPYFPVHAETVEQFYKGKALSLVTSVQAGAPGTDAVARIVAHYMQNYLPGKPTITVQNMPGAGHLRAANYLFREAPKDGTYFGLIWPAYVMHQIIDGRSVEYDAAKFNYLGSTGLSNATVVAWHTTGINTVEDAKKREVLMGATGAGSDEVLYPEILNSTVGTKFKIIMGYTGLGDVSLAMQKGEIEGVAGAALSTLDSMDWMKNHQVNVLVQIGDAPEPGYEQIPMLTSLASDTQTREELQFFSNSAALGRPFMTPPGIPADRLAALRSAFAAALQDPGLIHEFQQGGLDLRPVGGDHLTELINHMVNVDKGILARVTSSLDDKVVPRQ